MRAFVRIAACVACAIAVPCQATSAPEGERQPFDERAYELSFNTFVANRQLEDARQAAAVAVRLRPDDPKWRERLARLFEWTQRPEEALEQWRVLALDYDDERGWDALRRLAPRLYDYRGVISVLERDALRGPLSSEQLARLVHAYEAAGEPRRGIAFLTRLDRSVPHRDYLEQVAFLEQRVGDDADALATLEELTARYGPRPEWAVAAATLYVLHGDVDAAYSVLAHARSAATPTSVAFWAMLADVALTTQHREEARDALLTLAEQQADDLEKLLEIVLLLDTHPDDMARVAEEGWRLHGDHRFAVRALERHAQVGAFGQGEALLKTIDAATLAALGSDVRFLLARGELRQNQGRLDEAAVDLQRALSIEPHDPAVRSAWLWLLIERRDTERLAAILRELGDADAPAALSPDVLTAAYVTVGDFHAALPLYRQRWESRRDDPVWLVDYSEALTGAGYVELAFQVRRRALKLLRAQVATSPASAWPLAARLALARTSGDPAARLVAAILESAPPADRASAVSADMLLLWLMRGEQYDRARLWLSRRYVRTLSSPAWAAFAVALAQPDRRLLGELLADETRRRGADANDLVEAAVLLDEPFLARQYAFEGLASGREDADLRRQLSYLIPATARSLLLEHSYATRGVIEGPRTSVSGKWLVTRTLAIENGLSHAEWDAAVDSGIGEVPATDWSVDTRLSWRHLRHAQSTLRVGVRSALERFPYAEFSHTRRVGRMHGRFSLGAGLIAEEGGAIRVGGRRDNMQLDLSWSLGNRSFIAAELGTSRYEGQDGEKLGEGYRINATAGMRLPAAHSGYTVRAVAGWHDYSREEIIAGKAAALVPAGAAPAASFFLPDDFGIVGLFAGFGEDEPDGYAPHWRPFVDTGATFNSSSGLGFHVSGGIAGPLIGNDRLSLSFERTDDESGLGETERRISLAYRYYY